MNTAVNRLIWQEYRSQRAIWLAVFAAVCLLQFMIRVNSQSVPLQYSVLMAIFGGAAFAVLSLTVSFAGEVDNRTDVLLRMLPCSTRDLVTGRLLGTAVGATLFVPAVVCFIFALEVILLGFNLIWPAVIQFETDQRPFDGMTLTFGEDLAFALAFSFAVVSIAFAGSLLTRKVFTTILLVSELVIVMFNLAFMIAHVMIGGGYTAGLSATQLAPWYAGTGMLVLVIALSLVGPWHRGQIPFSLRGRFSQSAEKPRSVRSWWWPSYWTNAWMIRLAAKPASRSRVMRTLVWKELRSVVPFMPFALLAMIGGYAFDLDSITPPTFMVFVPLFVCFECGQRSLRDDQRSGTLRTLASMGLSPGTVWIAKTLIWLGTAAASIATILLLDFLLAWWAQAPADRSLWTPGNTPGLRLFVGTLYLDVISAYGIAAIVAAFSVGQLAAAWVERQILAFAVGLLSMFFIVVLGAMFFNFGWSLWLTAVPIAIVLLAIAGWTSTEWVEGRWSWRIVLRRMAMLVVPVVVCSALGWSWWRYEPQWAMSRLRGLAEFRESIHQPSEKLIHQMDGSFWKEVTSARDEASPWNRFSRLLVSVESVPVSVARLESRRTYKILAGPEWAENIAKLLEPFDELVSQSAEAWPDLPIEMTTPWEDRLVPLAIVGVLIEDARLKTSAGQYQDAGQRLILAVQLARKFALQTASWDKWRTCLLAEQSALDHLRALTNAHSAELELPKLYGSLQESVLVKFDSDQRPIVLFPDPRPMLHRRTLYAGLLYGIDSNEDYRKSVSRRFSLGEMDSISFWSSGIHDSGIGRQADLMRYSEMLVRMRLNNVPIGGNILFDGRSRPPIEYHHQNHDRLLDRSALWDLPTDAEVLHRLPASNSAITAMGTAMANERAALLTLLLQQHRKDHGSFPATLFDLNIDPVAQRLVRIDPFTGQTFFYAPAGVSKPVLLTPAAVRSEDQLRAPKNQPLLASAGPLGGLTMETATLPPKTEQDPLQWKFVKLPENAIVFLMYSTSQDDTLRDLPTFP